MPFVICCDLKCFTTKLHYKQSKDSDAYTTDVEIHNPACYAIVVTNKDDKVIIKDYYDGSKVIDNTWNTIDPTQNQVE